MNNKNRGKIPTSRIAEKLKQAGKEIETEIKEQFETTLAPLLFISGRLDRKHYSYIAKNFSLLEELNQEIKKYCKGVDLTLLNYLIYKGLESVKKQNKFIVVEYSEIEKNIKLNK
jgi:hypothetical protein